MEDSMARSFEDCVKDDFVLIMGALADQRDTSLRLEGMLVSGLAEQRAAMERFERQVADGLADQRAATQKLEKGMTRWRDHILTVHAASKKSDTVLANHEKRLQKLEKRKPPAA